MSESCVCEFGRRQNMDFIKFCVSEKMIKCKACVCVCELNRDRIRILHTKYLFHPYF